VTEIVGSKRGLVTVLNMPENNVGGADIFAIELQMLQYLLAHQDKLKTKFPSFKIR